MPCLNEAETLAACIEKARLGIERSGVHGEILVADNGSQDSSEQVAEEFGARVIHVGKKGYGSALAGGIHAASGRWISPARLCSGLCPSSGCRSSRRKRRQR